MAKVVVANADPNACIVFPLTMELFVIVETKYLEHLTTFCEYLLRRIDFNGLEDYHVKREE